MKPTDAFRPCQSARPHQPNPRTLEPLPVPQHRTVNLIPRLSSLVVAAFLAWTLAPQAFAKEALTVAVFDFEAKDESVRELGAKIAALISASLSSEPRLIMVERAELEKVLGEQELSLSGTVAPETAARLNHLTGAKVLVTGRAFKVEKELVIVAKIIGTETSRVYGELVKSASKPLTDLCADLSGQIAQTITSKSDTLLAKSKTREERIAAIRKSFKGQTRPVISVQITERHIGRQTMDPAAESELALILGKCGFQLTDSRSDTRASIELIGEAFSEFGMRKGNLVSCKARVEIKARSTVGGKILGVDRQTSVAVDLSEQIAAKLALELAALELAERLVPMISKQGLE